MKKGQVALEFIMTYGWAILVVLVAIGALAYFGVLSPAKYLPEKCIMSTGFNCGDFVLYGVSDVERSEVEIQIINNIGEAVKLEKGYIQSDFETGSGAGTNCGNWHSLPLQPDSGGGFTPTYTLSAGESVYLTCNPGTLEYHELPVGQNVKVRFSFNYTKASGTYLHRVTGDLSGEVQE